MNTLPKDYVVLGHIKDINVPKSWKTNTFYNDTFKEHLPRFAYHTGDGNWKKVLCGTAWIPKSGDFIVAAHIGSPLYNMNLPKKSARVRPTVKQVKELENKLATLEEENKKLREQLAAISKIIEG